MALNWPSSGVGSLCAPLRDWQDAEGQSWIDANKQRG